MSSSEEEEVDDFLGFGLFDGVLNEKEEEEKVKKDKISAKESVEKLMEHLGGFEFWPDLIDDCKEVVAKFLDYKSLTKLGMCSKSDNALAKKIPLDLYSITIQDNEKYHYQLENEEFENVHVKVQFDKDFNSGKRFEMVFSQLENNTQIRWMKCFQKKRPEKMCLVIENSNYYEEAVKYAEQWMERCQFKLKDITVEMFKYPLETSKIKFLPNCTGVRIGADTLETFRWWMDRVPEKLDNLQFVTVNEDRETFTLPSDFLSLPQVMEAKIMYFWVRAAFSDEQFLKLKARRISFDAVNITDDGVNEFLKKWINGKGVRKFKEVLLWSYRSVDQQRVMRGLQVRPWDDAFEQEACGFCEDFSRCCGRGKEFQITSLVEPLESLTLSFSFDNISIYATGTKWNGKTSYSIP